MSRFPLHPERQLERLNARLHSRIVPGLQMFRVQRPEKIELSALRGRVCMRAADVLNQAVELTTVGERESAADCCR